MCSSKEVCVNAWVGNQHDEIPVARCVPQSAFKSMDSIDDDMDGLSQGRGQGQDSGPVPMDRGDDSEEDNSGHIGGEKRRRLERGFVLGGKQASLVVSREDGLTPMDIGSLEVDAAVDEQYTQMESSCRDCLELRTRNLALDTARLNVEATLMTAGTGVATGVLWVALFSG